MFFKKKEKYKGEPKYKNGETCVWIDTNSSINRLVTIVNYYITQYEGIVYLIRDNATLKTYFDVPEKEIIKA